MDVSNRGGGSAGTASGIEAVALEFVGPAKAGRENKRRIAPATKVECGLITVWRPLTTCQSSRYSMRGAAENGCANGPPRCGGGDRSFHILVMVHGKLKFLPKTYHALSIPRHQLG